MTDKQPKALRLARELEGVYPVSIQDQEAAAAELRRLLAANIDCVAWYEALKSQRDELLKALNDYRAKAHEMTVQRDALRDAAKNALNALQVCGMKFEHVEAELRAAITKTESAL